MNAALGPDTKDALARELPGAQHCRTALLHGLAFYGRDRRGASFVTYRNAVARLFWTLLEERKAHPIRASSKRALRAQPRFSIDLPTHLHGDPPRPERRCDRFMELRAAFLLFGVVTAGTRGYHLELAPPDEVRAKRLQGAIAAAGVPVHSSLRRGRRVFYLKDFDAIADLLARVGAHGAVLALEDVRALRETKNRIHRLVNTETANLGRAARAAASQSQTIAYLERAYGLRRLPRPLREIAMLRLRFPEDTLADLGRRCNPAAGKPTVASRFAALARLAVQLRNTEHAARQGRRDGGR